MTTWELDGLTLAHCDLMDTAANRQRYGPVLLAAYNEAYDRACREALRPVAWVQVTLENGSFPLAALEGLDGEGVLAVRREYDPARDEMPGLRWRLMDGRVWVEGAADDTLWVRYRRRAEPLLNPNPTTGEGATAPALLPSYRHSMLCHAGEAALWRMERQYARADQAQARFEGMLAALARAGDATLRGLYRTLPE